MAKARSLESRLAHLNQLRQDLSHPSLTQELRTALADRANFVVAKAAEMISQANGAGLANDLVAAFDRMLVNPLETDKLCVGKTAVVEALNRIEFDSDDFFRRSIRYVQMEPVWKGKEDSAGAVRVACAAGLVRLNPITSLPYLADLLADEEKVVRMGAAQVLAGCMASAAVPLLRLKVRLGDGDPEVISECFSSLLTLDKESAIPFVAEFLSVGDPAVCSAAILALGESRQLTALEPLTRLWNQGVGGDLREELLLAITLLRLPASTAFLLDLLDSRPEHAAAVVAALAVLRHDAHVRNRVEATIVRSGSAALRSVFQDKFRTE
jgi:HEAT repeat protein